jgi:hypothetical protein
MVERLIGFFEALFDGRVSGTCAFFGWGLLIALSALIVFSILRRFKNNE